MDDNIIEITVPAEIPTTELTAFEEPARCSDAYMRQMYRVMADMQKLLVQRDAAITAMAEAQRELLSRLAVAAELKDTDTSQHIVRIGVLSAVLASLAGMDDTFCERLFRAAPMHDVGKIGIPDAVLKKPGPLNNAELLQMRMHPEIGARILGGSTLPELQLAAEVALGHHEKYDGSGYPKGLSGGQIPLSARVVALVDFFDALLMDRCYRPGVALEEVRRMIEDGRGKHFDPLLVSLLLANEALLVEVRTRVNQEVDSNNSTVLPDGYWKRLMSQ